MNGKKFTIVKFETDSKVEMVPSSWIVNDNTCFWPSEDETPKNLCSMIRKCTSPVKTWSQLTIKIYGASNSFSRANCRAESLRCNSTIETDSPNEDQASMKERLKRPPARFRYDNEDDYSQCLISGKKQQKLQSPKIYTLPDPPPVSVTKASAPDSNSDEDDASFIENTQITSTQKKQKLTSSRITYTLPTAKPVPVTKVISTGSYSNEDNNDGIENTSANLTLTDEEEKEISRDQENSLSFLYTEEEEPSLKKILHHLNAITQQNIDIKKELNKLREKVELKLQADENPQVAAAIGDIVKEEFPYLPLINNAALQKLEDAITRSASKATSLARFLCRGSGCINSNALTLLVMKRLMSRDVALNYSLEGRQQKFKFSELNLFHVVVASVKMKFPDVEIRAISSRIGKVLAGAPDWDGNRIRNKRKAHQDEENLDC